MNKFRYEEKTAQKCIEKNDFEEIRKKINCSNKEIKTYSNKINEKRNIQYNQYIDKIIDNTNHLSKEMNINKLDSLNIKKEILDNLSNSMILDKSQIIKKLNEYSFKNKEIDSSLNRKSKI